VISNPLAIIEFETTKKFHTEMTTTDVVRSRVQSLFAELVASGVGPNEAAVRALREVQAEVDLTARVAALTRQLEDAGLDADTARALMESSDEGGYITISLAEQLSELFLEAGVQRVHICVDAPPDGASVGDILLLPAEASGAAARFTVGRPGGESATALSCTTLSSFGMHTLTDSHSGSVQPLLVTSASFDLALALDSFFDALFWKWEDGWLDDELEVCLCELLVSVDEDLSRFQSGFAAFSARMGSDDEIQALVTLAQRELRGALRDRDGGSIGRLHQTLFQFLDMGELCRMLLPSQFVSAIQRFDALKCARCIAALRPEAETLCGCIERYADRLASVGGAVSRTHGTQLERLRALSAGLQSHLASGEAFPPSLLWGLLDAARAGRFRLEGFGTLIPARSQDIQVTTLLLRKHPYSNTWWGLSGTNTSIYFQYLLGFSSILQYNT
jgi:hypothetical protein